MSHYGTLAAADVYHADRGNAAWAVLDDTAKTVSLVRGSDYIDQMFRVRLKSGRWVSSFCGRKTSPTQEREFPRDNMQDYEGNAVADGTTPPAIENATYEAALREAAAPGSLMPDFTPSTDLGAVTQETVGPITVKYADLTQNKVGYENRPPNMPVIPVIETTVAPYLCGVATANRPGIMTV